MKKTITGASIKIFLLALFLFAQVIDAEALTRAEVAASLFDALEYKLAAKYTLPPDVPEGHRYAAKIGSASQYGLLPKDYFRPDDAANRHESIRMALTMIGWKFEVELYESLVALPDFSGSGDPVFFLAAEMKPPAPEEILIDGDTPLSDSALNAIVSWVRNCKKQVVWNRVFSHAGTDLVIYRQGAARPGEENKPQGGNPIGARDCEPMYIAAIAVHPDTTDQRIVFAEPLGFVRFVPSDFSQAYDAIGIINGGFFAGNRPVGSMLVDGLPAGKSIADRSAFGWNNGNGTYIFGNGTSRGGVRTSKGYVEFAKYNVAPPENEASLYIPIVTQAAMGAAVDAVEIIVKDGVVLEKRTANSSDHRIPEGCIMIVARGTARDKLEELVPGAKVNLINDWETMHFASCSDVIQAGPMLLQNGVFTNVTESFQSSIIDKRHPRTFVGTDGRRIFWAVVDGRSNIHSRGTTMEETRWAAKALGLTTALNMDGGGSSQLVWRGILINSPSDGRERALPYALAIVPKGTELKPRNIHDRGEFGEWGDLSNDSNSVWMDTYNPID